MSLFRNIVFTAMIAGLLSGLLLTVMQSFSTVPLILKAEVFENAAPEAGHSHEAVPAAGPAAPAAEHHHGEEAWAPADGFERFIYTAAANMLSAIGFALVLIAASEAFGGFKGWRGGLMFGIAGFLTVILAPGLGLPPELPGMPAAGSDRARSGGSRRLPAPRSASVCSPIPARPYSRRLRSCC